MKSTKLGRVKQEPKVEYIKKSIHEQTAYKDRPLWAQDSNPRVGIAVSALGTMSTAFVRSLVGAMRTALNVGIVTDLVIDETKPLDDSRNATVRELLKNKPDYIFFMDSDMLFPHNIIQRLMVHQKDIVTAVYPEKIPPFKPVLRRYNKDTDSYNSITHYPRGHVFTIDACGAGALLVKSDVFYKLKPPYFKWDNVTGRSEDIYFCEKAREAGYDIWVDGRIECQHMVDYVAASLDEFWKLRAAPQPNPYFDDTQEEISVDFKQDK